MSDQTELEKPWIEALQKAVPGLKWSLRGGQIQGWHDDHGLLSQLDVNGRGFDVQLILHWDYSGNPDVLAGNLRDRISNLWKITNDLLTTTGAPIIRWERLGRGHQLMVGEHRIGRICPTVGDEKWVLVTGKQSKLVEGDGKRALEAYLSLPEIDDWEE